MPPAAPLRRGGAFPFRRKTLVSDPYLKACGTTGPTGCGSQKNLLGSFFSFLDRFWIVMVFSYFFSRVHRDLTRVLQGVVLVRCGVLDPDAGSDWHEQDRLLGMGGAGGLRAAAPPC